MAFDWRNALGLVNTQIDVPVNAQANFDQSKKQMSYTYAPVTSTSRQSTVIDARTLQLTLNSPNAVTKKSDKMSASPLLENMADSRPSTGMDAGDTSAKLPLDIGLSTGGSSLLLFGGLLIAGGVIIAVAGRK